MSYGVAPPQNLRPSCFGSLVMGLVLLVGGLFVGAWLFMLAVGVVRGEWVHSVPTIGYWASVKVCAFGLPLLLSPIWARMEITTPFGCFSFILTLIVGGAGLLLAVSWLFMLGVGVVHGEWLAGLPTIGYWSSVKVCAFGLPLMLSPLVRPATRIRARPVDHTPLDDVDLY
jgi:hypothetical protein